MRYIPYIPPYERIPYGFCPADDDEYEEEEIMEDNTNEQTNLIQVVQLPIITEQLHTLKDKWEQYAADAKAMVCNEDTIQSVKKFRADINREFEQVEELRKTVKETIMRPYNDFESVYRECVTKPKETAESELKIKVSETEEAIKKQCEDGLREYFTELCVGNNLEWLKYEQAGIRIDMASAKSKTPNKLRKQLVRFVIRVAESVDRINALENADEIMVEFQRTLDASVAIFTVQERHRRIEEQRLEKESREADKISQDSAEQKVEESCQKYLKPPTEAIKTVDKGDNEIIPRCTFTAVNATRSKLRKLKNFLNEEGIQYE